MIGCLPTQALAFLAVFVYATHATQAIAFEWKPGVTSAALLLLLLMMMMMQEREALEHKQAWYQQVHPSDVNKENEYIAFCNDTKLRLHVSELRLNRSTLPQ